MNIIVIVSDTLRRDHLGCYGNSWISTPNIDKFAKDSLIFEEAYAASFPTVPNRRDLVTGRYTFTYSDWSPLSEKEMETVLAEVLGKEGYISMLIADTPHIFGEGNNYQHGFSGWLQVRGQENDRLTTYPGKVKLPASPHKLRDPEGTVKQYLRNVSLIRRSEEDYFCAQTMREAGKWLEKNYKEKFFLWVDTFDPHEPWDPPHYYVDLYDKGYQGEEIIYPVYGPSDYLTARELKHIRAHYAGEITLVDRWVGNLFRKIEDLGLLENSMVIFTTDHGFYHGEHGLIGKTLITEKYQGLAPLYEEVTHIPLLIHLPRTKPSRIPGFVQPPDLMPTILELAKAEDPGTTNGKSILPLIKGEGTLRDFAVTSPSIIYGSAGGQRSTITTKEWALIYGVETEKGAEYETRIVDGRVKIQKRLGKKVEPELYHLPSDPKQKKNVFSENKDIARKIHSRYIKFLENIKTEEKYLKPWRLL